MIDLETVLTKVFSGQGSVVSFYCQLSTVNCSLRPEVVCANS